MLSEIFKDLFDLSLTNKKDLFDLSLTNKKENNTDNIEDINDEDTNIEDIIIKGMKPTVTINGEVLDLSSEDNVQKAYDFIDTFAKSPITKLFMGDDDINNICTIAKNNIEALHASLTTDESDEDDDSIEIATNYLKETVDNWEDVPDEQKKRSIRAITDFIDWLAEHVDEQ